MLMNRKAKTVNVLEGPMTESCAEFPARHVFIKCPECRRVIDEARLHDNLEVCPRCGKHFRVSGRDRMHMTIDEARLRNGMPVWRRRTSSRFPVMPTSSRA